MPASKGTKARTTAVKRARNTLTTPYMRIRCALRSISPGKRLSGQPLSICRRYRCPSQKEKPSPTIAPATAAMSNPPGGNTGGRGERTDCKDQRGARHHGPDHRNSFRQRQQENRKER